MEEVRHITYKDKKLLRLEFPANAGYDQVHTIIEAAKPLIHNQPQESVLVLSLVLFTDPEPRIMEAMEEFTKSNKPYIKASAVVGITGIRKALFNAILGITGRTLKLFNTEEEALEYLISQ